MAATLRAVRGFSWLWALALLAACGSGEAPTSLADGDGDGAGSVAVIRMRGGGEIRMELLAGEAPRYVENFARLASEGFYDGTTFHRVIPGFTIQGGDPLSRDDDPANDGFGGPGWTVGAELNDVPHARGTVSMARQSHPDSAGSQFFIVLADSPSWRDVLDGNYTVFGRVLSGMDVVDEIAAAERDLNDRPRVDQVIESIRIVEVPLVPRVEEDGS